MIKHKTLIVCGAAGMALALAAAKTANAQTAIVENGQAKATIYMDASAPSAVKRAASELREHVKLVSGVDLPVVSDTAKLSGYVIYLGDTAFARKQGIKPEMLPPDGYRVLSNKNWMVIAGKDYVGPVMVGFNNPWRFNESYNTKLDISAFGDAGTLFGVYHILEQFAGVRWYMPGPLGTVAPEKKKIVIPPLNLRKAPVFEHRHAYYGFMERSDDDALWYRRAGYGTPAPIQVSHSFGQFFHKYKDTNPEYFAIIDGQRDFTNLASAQADGTYNLSNPGLIQRAIEVVNKYFDENPTQKIFPLCPPDGWNRISEDPESQAQLDKTRGDGGEFSNYVWGFVNKVAKGVAKKHPDKLVGCIAYSKYGLPPTNIDKLEPNVAVVICKLRIMYPDPKSKKEMEENMEGWKKKASTLYAWEYYCNSLFNAGWQGYPMFFTSLLQNDLKNLKGVTKGEFIEAESWLPSSYQTEPEKIKIIYPGIQHPLLYITARLLWNPDLNLKALLDEYYKSFYGPAEKPMRAFWELVDTNWNKKSWHSNPSEVYDNATIIQLLDHLKAAQNLSSTDSVYRKRVDLIFSEFSPAAEVSRRLAALSKPAVDVPQLTSAPQNTPDSVPPLAGASNTVRFLDRGFNVASPGTNMQIAWDQKNIYIDLRSYEPDMDKLRARATARDSIEPPLWDDDVVEFFLAPDPADPDKTYHYIVNANGAVFDATIAGPGKGENRLWDGNARISIKKEATRWIAQVAIPWTDLGVTNPQAGQKIRANFYRSRIAVPPLAQSSWAPLQDGPFYSPQNFGTLTLQGPKAKSTVEDIPPVIYPASVQDYGSGSSIAGFYGEGGLGPVVGLVAGQPNSLNRNDRVIARFDLRPLQEASERIEKVELQFTVNSIAGNKNERALNIQHLKHAVETMGPAAVATTDVDDVSTLNVSGADALTGAANQAAVKPKAVDVTSFIKADLARGQAATVFRWRDVQAEIDGNPINAPTGVTIAQAGGRLPSLVITLKK